MKKALIILGLWLFFAFPPQAVANDAPYCSSDRHLCECYSVLDMARRIFQLDSSTRTQCCLNVLPSEAVNVNFCGGATDPLVPVTGKVKAATCSPGYTNPLECWQADPKFCCRSSAVPFTCSEGVTVVCNNTKNIAKDTRPRTYCGNDGKFAYDIRDGICHKVAASLWSRQSTCDNGTTGVQTGIGCVPTGDLSEFLKFILRFVFFASGGIIVLMTIATGYTIITSGGNPEKLQAAKENIVALLSGLALIAFSLVLLQAIGADILNLPTFLP